MCALVSSLSPLSLSLNICRGSAPTASFPGAPCLLSLLSHSQQRLLLIDAPLHNTFLELWTMVHFLIPGISRPYLHLPLKAPNDENQDYYHKVVIRLHRVLRAAAVVPCVRWVWCLGKWTMHTHLFFSGDTALYLEEN